MAAGYLAAMPARSSRRSAIADLSYASPAHPRLKRWFIRSVEGVSGRERYAGLYDYWRREVVPTGDRIFGRMLELVGIGLDCPDAWPPADLPAGPLVMVANHPFGIGDGIAALSLAERLGRPFRVMIHRDLLKIEEMRPYALPVDFSETKEAIANNMSIRHEAVRLLREGVTIVVFPAGGVATAPKGLGRAEDLPWKIFPARLVQEAKASVVPVYFSGQNGRLFHLVSRPMHLTGSDSRAARLVGNISLTLRLSLLIREFARLSGRSIGFRTGRPIPWDEFAPLRDRKAVLERMRREVFALAPEGPARRAVFRRRVRGQSGPSAGSTADASLASTSTS